MRFTQLASIFLLALSLGVFAPSDAVAFAPPNQRWYPYAESNQLIPKVARTGELTWRATDRYGWPQWRSVVSRSLDTGSDYQFSLGNVYGGVSQLVVREATGIETPDTEHFAEAASVVQVKCNGDFATACVYLLNALPVPAYYKAAAMISWTFPSQGAVVEHETNHPVSQACDQYVGGCQPTDSSPFQCLGNPETLMDCNLAARYPQDYDVGTYLGAYTPDHPAITTATLQSGGWVRITWGHDRKDRGFASPFKTNSRNGVEVAVAFSQSPNEPPEWVGRLGCGQAFGFCYSAESAGERSFDAYWTSRYHCAWLRVENRVVRFVAQSSQLGLNGSTPAGYWALAGCW